MLRDALDRLVTLAMMAQLENVGGLGGPFVAQGDVAVSWSPASDGPMSSVVTSFSNEIGSAPNFRLFARSRASCSLKSPVMLERPSVMTAVILG